MTSTLDVANTIATYTSSARFRSSHATPLALQLARVAPPDLTPAEKKALDTIRLRADELDAIRKNRQRVSAPSLQRPRNATATAWTALATSLGAVATIPPELGPEGPTATALAATLFPTGTAFGQQDANAVWSHSKMLIERIAEEGHRPSLESVVSPALLRAIEKAHADLGRAIGVTGDLVELPGSRSLAEALARFAFAITAYARALSIGLDETTDEAFERFKTALAPIDSFRIRGTSTEVDGDGEEEEPVTPRDEPFVPASDDPIDNPFIT